MGIKFMDNDGLLGYGLVVSFLKTAEYLKA